MNAASEPIDLESFEDAEARVYLLSEACQGNPSALAAVQAELREEESRGWCRILHMTDEIAVVRWSDTFVLTIVDPSTREMIGVPPLKDTSSIGTSGSGGDQ